MDEELQSLHPAVRALKTICRCNNIKHRTIERAIQQGAKTIAEVARKTTATTGYCGGTCTPVVQGMIDAICTPATPAAAAVPDEDAWWIRPATEKK